jgi:hypothetical protein
MIPPDVSVIFYDAADLIDTACHTLIDSVPATEHLVLSFDIKYNMDQSPGIDMITFGTAHTVYLLKVGTQL